MNSIKQYLESEERSISWLSRQLDLTPAAVWQWLQLSDKELKYRLSIVHYFQLCELIPNFETKMKGE